MDNFPAKWMEDICAELNNAGLEMPKENGGGKWDKSRFENSIQLMKMHVTLDAGIYDFLNTKGLINRGYCPITGEQIGTEYLYQLFGRKVYISKQGQEISKEWDRKEHIKLFGSEPRNEGQNSTNIVTSYRKEKPSNFKLVGWLFLIIAIIYVIKKC